jgi:hypothetical protein
MSNRPYYSQRAGRGPATAALELNDLKRLFKSQYEQLEQEGYFQEYLGFECVDSGFNPGVPDRPSDIHQDALARFRETIFWARSMKARKLAAMWRRPG